MRKCTGCGVLKGKGHFYGDNKKMQSMQQQRRDDRRTDQRMEREA